jgi:aldehyde:ferredoxin oxidoreductase
VTDRRAYRKTYDAIFRAATESDLMKKYHQLGTSMNVIPLDAAGGPGSSLRGCGSHFRRTSGKGLPRPSCGLCPLSCRVHPPGCTAYPLSSRPVFL